MRSGLAMIIQKVHISKYFESPATDLQIAENAGHTEFLYTWLSKWVHGISKSPSPQLGSTYYGCEEFSALGTSIACASLLITSIHPRVARNPKFSDHPLLLASNNQSTIVKSIMDVVRPLRYWTLWMSKRYTVILHHVNTVYNDMFDHTNVIMWTSAKKTTQLMQDLVVAVKLAQQKLSNNMPKWLQWHECFPLRLTSSLFYGSCDRLGSGIREWRLILKKRHPILPNTIRTFWSRCRMTTVPILDMCWSINLKEYRVTISSVPQRLQDLVNHCLIHTICPAMMKNTQHLPMRLKWHPDEVITLHTNWLLPVSIWIHRLKHQRTGGK